MESDLLDSEGRFEEYAQDALDSLPSDLRAQMSNVEIVVEDEPPPGQPLLGLYQGVPLTRRGSHYGAVLATLERTPWSPARRASASSRCQYMTARRFASSGSPPACCSCSR
jgi:hypothetical protein